MGVAVEELEDGVRIAPAKDGEIHGAKIETFGDHRVAMAFTLPGLLIPGVVIKDPGCCRKTFENYFEIWDSILS
jgi:3-phosphoshikimate 1-carboxyvinyltransferase